MERGSTRSTGSRSVLLSACLSLSVTAVSLLAIPSLSGAETQLPTIIDEDMTWTEAGSPYIGSSSDIRPGVTVTVEPGVTTKLSGKLNVDGTLNVDGSPRQPRPLYFD